MLIGIRRNIYSNMGKINELWPEFLFRNITWLNRQHITAVCPKVQWLYWADGYRYEMDLWGPRSVKNRYPELIWSESWTRLLNLWTPRFRFGPRS